MEPTGRVDPERLRELVERNWSIRRIAAEFGVSYSTVRYWLGKAELQTVQGVRRSESEAARRAGFVARSTG